jgi:hypothetical protein
MNWKKNEHETYVSERVCALRSLQVLACRLKLEHFAFGSVACFLTGQHGFGWICVNRGLNENKTLNNSLKKTSSFASICFEFTSGIYDTLVMRGHVLSGQKLFFQLASIRCERFKKKTNQFNKNASHLEMKMNAMNLPELFVAKTPLTAVMDDGLACFEFVTTDMSLLLYRH